MRRGIAVSLILAAALLWAKPVRVKFRDAARLRGVRRNQLIGFGLVVGLNGSGDTRQSLLTRQTMKNVLKNLGVRQSAERLSGRNSAVVIVTASLPAFAVPGDRIDIQVSSLGDAKSLAGGVLLQTPLRGGDDQVYAAAQGTVVIGAEGKEGHPTSASLSAAAIVERGVDHDLSTRKKLVYHLRKADAVTVNNAARAIRRQVEGIKVTVLTPAALQIDLSGRKNVTELIAAVEAVDINISVPGRVVINERTGTIVMGGDVRISPVIVSHRNIELRIGQKKTEGSAAELKGTTTVQEVITGLNALGVKTPDMIAILQAVKRAGALHAEVVTM